jgi:hypothetical protein
MSDRIPIIARAHVSERAARTLYVTLLAGDPGTISTEALGDRTTANGSDANRDIVKKFVEEKCIPADAVGNAQIPNGEGRWVCSSPTTICLPGKHRLTLDFRTPTQPSLKTSRPKPASLACGTCSCQRATTRSPQASPTSSTA